MQQSFENNIPGIWTCPLVVRLWSILCTIRISGVSHECLDPNPFFFIGNNLDSMWLMTVLNHPVGAMVNILASSVVDCRVGPLQGLTKKKKRRKKRRHLLLLCQACNNKEQEQTGLDPNQNNVSVQVIPSSQSRLHVYHSHQPSVCDYMHLYLHLCRPRALFFSFTSLTIRRWAVVDNTRDKLAHSLAHYQKVCYCIEHMKQVGSPLESRLLHATYEKSQQFYSKQPQTE